MENDLPPDLDEFSEPIVFTNVLSFSNSGAGLVLSDLDEGFVGDVCWFKFDLPGDSDVLK